MSFEILTADGASGERWSRLVAALPPPLRDLHFLPDYGLIYRDTYGQEPLLAVYQDDSGVVLQPLVRRALDDLPFLAGTGEHAADIANPYGFGAPLASVTGPTGHALMRRFVGEFDAWCDRERIASEFASLHPLLIEHQLPALLDLRRPERTKDVVVVPLAGGEDALRAGLSRGQRSNIAKATRHGVQVERVPADPAHLAIFSELYYATMHRRNAAARWLKAARSPDIEATSRRSLPQASPSPLVLHDPCLRHAILVRDLKQTSESLSKVSGDERAT